MRWDVPVELVQYRQTTAPPPLPTNPPLPSEPPPSLNGQASSSAPHQNFAGQAASHPSSVGPQMSQNHPSAGNSQSTSSMIGPQQPSNSYQPAGGKAVLIAYDDSDSETDEKFAEQDPSKLSSKGQEHTTDDILALLEAEKPPDYVAPEMNSRGASTAAVNGGSTMVHGTSANSGFQPPTNQFAAPPPSVPVRRPQLGSMLQVTVGNYCNSK